MTMTREGIKLRIEAHIEKWQALLGLSAWRILILWDESSDNTSCMQVNWPKHYRKATLSITPSFETATDEALNAAEWDEPSLENNVIHELLHLVFAPLRDVIRENCGQYSSLLYQHHDINETVIDSLVPAIRRIEAL